MSWLNQHMQLEQPTYNPLVCCSSRCARHQLPRCTERRDYFTGFSEATLSKAGRPQSIRSRAAQRTAIATDGAPDPEDFPWQLLSNYSTSQARRAAAKPAAPSAGKIILSLLHTFAVIALLILFPAWVSYKCIPAREWAAAAAYFIFFGFGGLRRTLSYGKLSSRRKDAQVPIQQGKAATVCFVLIVVACHWRAVLCYGSCKAQGMNLIFSHPAFQAICAGLLCAALVLHIWANETLGEAYDPLVVPGRLVKTGPYAWCQHPIYTSHMLLFSSFTLLFRSEECCILLLYVCWRYYKHCTKVEAEILDQVFGNEYKVYHEHTGCFVPRLV